MNVGSWTVQLGVLLLGHSSPAAKDTGLKILLFLHILVWFLGGFLGWIDPRGGWGRAWVDFQGGKVGGFGPLSADAFLEAFCVFSIFDILFVCLFPLVIILIFAGIF